jgi:hypothetical protein
VAEFTLGLDVGQLRDPTALAAVRLVQSSPEALFRCGHLERMPLNTLYPDIVAHVGSVLRTAPFRGNSELVLDATGVGRGVIDMFKQEGIRPICVTITGGNAESYVKDSGEHHVAKIILVTRLQQLLQSGRLEIQADLPTAKILETELQDFRADYTDSGLLKFNAREGQHDDLVLALAIAIWRAYKRRRGHIDPGVVARSAMIRRPSSLGYNDDSRSSGGYYGRSGVYYDSSNSHRGAELHMLQNRAMTRGRG